MDSTAIDSEAEKSKLQKEASNERNLELEEAASTSASTAQPIPVAHSHPIGVAPIKSEYLLPRATRTIPNAADHLRAAEPDSNSIPAQSNDSNSDEPTAKRIKLDDPLQPRSDTVEPKQRLSGAAKRKAAKLASAQAQGGAGASAAASASGKGNTNGNGKDKEKKGKGGQNHARKFNKMKDSLDLCPKILDGEECDFGDGCKFTHDVNLYLSSKPSDIYLPHPPSGSNGSLYQTSSYEKSRYLDQNYSSESPFLLNSQVTASVETDDTRTQPQSERSQTSLNHQTCCPAFSTRGHCNNGLKCRFLGAHSQVQSIKREGQTSQVEGKEELQVKLISKMGDLKVDKRILPEERNYVRLESLRMLQKKNANLYPFTLSDHVSKILDSEPNAQENTANLEFKERKCGPIPLDYETLSKQAFEKWEESLKALEGGKGKDKGKKKVEESLENDLSKEKVQEGEVMGLEEQEEMMMNSKNPSTITLSPRSRSLLDSTPTSSLDISRIRLPEKRRLNWANQLYLAPLTTTGNLPFRRICSEFGSDIHCGEMGLSDSFLNANKSEWSLVKKWQGEKTFGIQVCGNKPGKLMKTAEVLMREVGEGLDFVDVNCGCPIDLVYNKGSGSALLDHPNKLGKIIRGMSSVLGEIPVTIKLRTGTGSKLTTHNLFPRLQTEFGVGAATLHGRTRKQRYKNRADWSYIKKCVTSLRESVIHHNESSTTADEEFMQPIPIFGNGDVYSYREYEENMKLTGVDGEMLARGALIKPWIFSEIKERRDWDISSRERLDIYRQYASYGLSHWGTDTQGVNTTRRFLCEAMSFTHRYVPIGILETLPPKLNDRPPPFKGRDELETLLASPNSKDWVKLSEMFLGKSPDDWKFVPKHKSNAWEESEDQG